VAINLPYPAWAPEKLDRAYFDSDEALIDKAYEVFCQDTLYNSLFSFRGKQIFLAEVQKENTNSILPNYKGSIQKERTFHHIISEEIKKERDRRRLGRERDFEIVRCESVPWILPIMLNVKDQFTCIYDYQKNGETRVNIWSRPLDYVVVLIKRGSVYLLLTAYNVLYSSKRNDLEKHCH
jgi:hypothetical protein